MTTSKPQEFDEYASKYEAALDHGLAISGETSSFFARERIGWLAKRLHQYRGEAGLVLDYGCGTGNSIRFFDEILKAKFVVGLDLSSKALEIACSKSVPIPVDFRLVSQYTPSQQVDLAFCNGVFHHVDPAERSATLRYMADCVRPGGFVAVWENNPWNLGTRYIMRRVPFDRDAILVGAREVRALAVAAKLRVLTTDFCFVFPAFLRFLRRFEPRLKQLPVGAQYLVLCRKDAPIRES